MASCEHALVLDCDGLALGEVALKLVRLGIPTHYARWVDEALLLVAQEAGRIRALVVPPQIDPAEARRVREAARALAPEATIPLVVAGPRPSELAPRREPRAPVSMICWVVVGTTRCFRVLCSLSAHGAFIEMPQPLPVGMEVELEFTLCESAFQTSARVIYRNAREELNAPNLPIGAGLLFLAMDPEDQERIREFVKQRAARFTA